MEDNKDTVAQWMLPTGSRLEAVQEALADWRLNKDEVLMMMADTLLHSIRPPRIMEFLCECLAFMSELTNDGTNDASRESCLLELS